MDARIAIDVLAGHMCALGQKYRTDVRTVVFDAPSGASTRTTVRADDEYWIPLNTSDGSGEIERADGVPTQFTVIESEGVYEEMNNGKCRAVRGGGVHTGEIVITHTQASGMTYTVRLVFLVAIPLPKCHE